MWTIQAVDINGKLSKEMIATSCDKLALDIMDRLSRNPLISVVIGTFWERGIASPPVVLQAPKPKNVDLRLLPSILRRQAG